LNQVEIYFSILQRKVLTPNDFPSLDALAERLFDFQYYWESAARPFEWKVTLQELAELLAKTRQSADCVTTSKIRDRIYETVYLARSTASLPLTASALPHACDAVDSRAGERCRGESVYTELTYCFL
jgi:hypothetical protein